ncbi:MAG: GNAT family N-acetyltransferase [Alphaproteobacteria bacterium]|nr:GNAT family N-acetyltransferase [Alphaproteobacteria bacterium]
MPITTNNPSKNRYELITDGHVSVAEYVLEGSTLTITRVFVPDELRGQGVAAKLMEAVISDAGERNLHIVPVCSYAQTYMTRHKL